MTEFLQAQNLVEQTISGDERKQFWNSHLESWEPSGLSQAEYCRRNDLNIPRFRYWKRKLGKENSLLEFVQLPTEAINSAQLL